MNHVPCGFDFSSIFGTATFDQFKLPPCVVLKDADIHMVMLMSKSKRERKYWAASIILGQPFA